VSNIDFAALNAQLGANADALAASWLPGGKRRGAEWVCANLHGGAGESFSINLNTGLWADFSTDQSGKDWVALYAAQHDLTQVQAARALAPEPPAPRANGHEAAAPAPAPVVEHAAEQAPADYPDPPRLAGLGAPSFVHPYYPAAPGGPLFLVVRYDQPSGKTIRPLTWRAGKWCWLAYPAPRPLYGLRALLAAPARRVLLVEGEKCADAASAALGAAYVVTTWSSGAAAHAKTDFAPLAGRDVTIWPDADAPGRKAMAAIAARLMGTCSRLALVKPPPDVPAGWDSADAIEQGLDIQALLAASAPIELPRAKEAQPLTRARPAHPTGVITDQDGQVESSAYVSWESLGLDRPANGSPFASLGNAVLILERHPDCQGKIWLDTFRGALWQSFAGTPAPFTDAQGLALLTWIHQRPHLSKFSLDTLHHAIAQVGNVHARNSVTRWLASLTWDGTPRLADWLADCLGVTKTPFTIAVARNWLISMVARAYQPGCQADHMPVLEGASGAGKSSALAIIGGEWYRAAPQAFGSKEFIEAIQASWLTEIPDMVGFGRREHTQIISAITTRSDVYRASYGRLAQEHPRVGIFAATSETDEYLEDTRGKRRYWPLTVTHVDLDLLARQRDQLFAEAVSAYLIHKATWHEVPGMEASLIQNARETTDLWSERIQSFLGGRKATSVAEVARDGLFIEVNRQSRSDQMRIAKCLKQLGFAAKVEWVEGIARRLYKRP
jgi:putative DNA primase/helicase